MTTGLGRSGILVAVLVLGLAVPALEAGRGHFERRAQRKGWQYPKLTRHTFIEDSLSYGRLTLCANVELAMFRLEDRFLPVLFALATEEKPALRVAPERFRLVLPDGTRLSPVPYARLIEEGFRSELTYDWSRRRTVDVTHGYFGAGYRRVGSQFYPDPAGRHARGVVVEAQIGFDDYVVDVLYFPNPGGLAGKELVLAYEDPLSGPDMEVVRGIEVTFLIPDPGPEAGEIHPQSRPSRRP